MIFKKSTQTQQNFLLNWILH